jgi:molecular chaperone DnaK
VVSLYKDKQELVGDLAVDNAETNPENTIFSVKRLMGRFWDDENVQKMRERTTYRIVKASDGSADVRVMFGDQELTPTDISAKILRKLKEDAEARLGETVTHAVITVPAYFSNLQRICTRKAGEQAGLRVKAIMDEPTAAARAFGLAQHHGDPMTVLVYDLGGGTFDVSILTMAGDYACNQMHIEGNMWLGGDDFDHKIMDYVLERIRKEIPLQIRD